MKLLDICSTEVSGSTLTNKKYGKALTILNERYRNKQAIVSTHMEKICEFTSCIVRCKHNWFRKSIR